MEALLVVDIQPETVKPRKAESFMSVWNELIGSYDPKRIAYIANLRPFARIPKDNPFADGLDIVSGNVFFKHMPNAFTNDSLRDWIAQMCADSVKIIGIDGNWCIKATAVGALKSGLGVTVVARAVCSKNAKVFQEKTIPYLRSRGVHF